MYLCWQRTRSPRSCHPAQRSLLLRMRLVGGRRVQHSVTRRFVQKFLPYRRGAQRLDFSQHAVQGRPNQNSW